MKHFNLTELALNNKALMYYFIIIVAIAGIFSYLRLGRMEDPDFVIRQMIVTVAWPGAPAHQIEEQLTDKIEKKLQETPYLDYLKSVSRQGSANIYVSLREDCPENQIRPTWLEVRNLVNDMRSDFPEGVVGPFFNDRFDDVFGSIYALTGEDYSYEELREVAEKIRRNLLDIENVKKVNLVGVQKEKIYIEVENSKLAQLGIPASAIASAVSGQNSVTPAGMIDTQYDNVYLRISGIFDSIEAIKELPVRANGRTFRLGDVANIYRGFEQPAATMMYFNGKPSIGIAASMQEGGNILKLGDELNETIAEVRKILPVGMEIDRVSDQPQVVQDSIDEFASSLFEAVAIVLAISFLSLGLRTGMVVALCIPLVLAGVFLAMYALGIDLHKVSLGALIIALGLLVDDEIISIEMMLVKLEEGLDRFKAAISAFEITAIPLLTGTLVTCAGFIPVGFSKGMAAEFTSALFPVIAIALLISWVVSLTVAPFIGYRMIKVKEKEDSKDRYDSKFYQKFRKILHWSLSNRPLVLIFTVGLFAFSIYMLQHIRQEFFPPATRPELIVEMTLPGGSSKKATNEEVKRLSQWLDQREGIASYSCYVGEGAPRFVLTTDPVLPASNYAQFVIVADSLDDRSLLEGEIRKEITENFPNVRENIKTIQTGPPSAYPVMLRVSGYDAEKVHQIASQIADIMAKDSAITGINFDWNEKVPSVKLNIDQDKLRTMGIDGHNLALTLQTQISGATVSQYYEADKTVDIVFRMAEQDRSQLDKIKELPVYLPSGQSVLLEQIASVRYDAEDAAIWRRDLKPTITVQANITSGTANDSTQRIFEQSKSIRDNLPFGYGIEVGGALESSHKSMDFILQPVPIMLLAICTILMFQLKSIPLMLMCLLTAPLGIIGVVFGMLIFDQPMGFVAQLGILSLCGMIIRNSIILIDQIEIHMAAGEDRWHAIIDSAVLRFRPIMLTAAAAIMAMIPLMRSSFWGPMAVAIAGGLFGATILTLLVLPVMYAQWFKVKETE